MNEYREEFKYFYEDYRHPEGPDYKRVWGLIKKRYQTPENRDALTIEEFLREVYIAIWKTHKKFDPTRSEKTGTSADKYISYFNKCLTNRLINVFEKIETEKKKRIAPEDVRDFQEDMKPYYNIQWNKIEFGKEIDPYTLKRLDPVFRKIIQMKCDHSKNKEIAREVNMEEKTLETNYSYPRLGQAIQEEIEQMTKELPRPKLRRLVYRACFRKDMQVKDIADLFGLTIAETNQLITEGARLMLDQLTEEDKCKTDNEFLEEIYGPIAK